MGLNHIDTDELGRLPLHLVAIALLDEEPHRLHEVWSEYFNHMSDTCQMAWISTFIEHVNAVIDDQCHACMRCSQPQWFDNGSLDVDENFVCDSCRGYYTACNRCDDFSVNHRWLNSVDGSYYCEPCRDISCTFCDGCETWYHDDNEDGHHEAFHANDCECDSRFPHFQIQANGHGTIHQNQRIEVKLPKGSFDEACVEDVISMLWDQQPDLHAVGLYALRDLVEGMDQIWQTKQGNFTKRLSKALYQQHSINLEPGLLSRIGSRVRDHTADISSWHLELTRDLNQSARAFYHGGSCWWGSESVSRCALKAWGGVGLRSYEDADTDSGRPNGRAWVQPLDETLQPISDVFGAHAYIIYNGYGAMEGYTGARLLAYLTSRTYKKIDVSLDYQYVNEEQGFLVADQATCESTKQVTVNRGPHEVAA